MNDIFRNNDNKKITTKISLKSFDLKLKQLCKQLFKRLIRFQHHQ
jgi:hypothetical protein